MSRLLIMWTMALCLLFACGQVITIALPTGLPFGGKAAYKDGSLPRGYERFLSPAAYNFRFSWPGEPVRRGAVSERYELRDGDCVDPDCKAGRLRAELREADKSETARVGQDIWYGWSFHNASQGAVTRDQSIGLVLGQWKPSGDQPPAFRIVQTAQGELDWTKCDPSICNREGSATDDVVAELENMKVASNWGPTQNYGDVCRLFSMAESRGKWVDILINTNFAAGPEGYLRIWVNGVLKCNYNGRMVWGSPALMTGTAISHRRGIFASYTKPWRAKQGGAAIPTIVVYYDEFMAGKGRADVDTAYRESAGLRPLD